MNTSKLTLAGTFLLASLLSVIGCSKDGDSTPVNSTHKIIFKAQTSPDASINMVVYGHDATLTTATSLNLQSWTSPEIIVPAGATIASILANARGSNASSTLKVQVYVDGVLKKEGTGTGAALSATAQFNLK